VQTKILHYSSLAYFPLTYLASLYIYRIAEGKAKPGMLTKTLLIIISAVWIIVVAGLTLAGLYKEQLIASGLIRDPFALANLQAGVRWTGMESLVAILLLAALLAFFFIKRPFARLAALFTGTMLFAFMAMFVFTGRIEGYSQRAALDFYRSRQAEDCYIRPLGFKSYAHLFYADKQPKAHPERYNQEWMLHGDIDLPVYFVWKVTKKEKYAAEFPHLQVLYEKNGFIFAARYPEKKPEEHD
jgi:hypothetical protein